MLVVNLCFCVDKKNSDYFILSYPKNESKLPFIIKDIKEDLIYKYNKLYDGLDNYNKKRFVNDNKNKFIKIVSIYNDNDDDLVLVNELIPFNQIVNFDNNKDLQKIIDNLFKKGVVENAI